VDGSQSAGSDGVVARGVAIEQAPLCRAKREIVLLGLVVCSLEKNKRKRNGCALRQLSKRGMFLCSRKFSILPATCS
jgi:hypothetical protein